MYARMPTFTNTRIWPFTSLLTCRRLLHHLLIELLTSSTLHICTHTYWHSYIHACICAYVRTHILTRSLTYVHIPQSCHIRSIRNYSLVGLHQPHAWIKNIQARIHTLHYIALNYVTCVLTPMHRNVARIHEHMRTLQSYWHNTYTRTPKHTYRCAYTNTYTCCIALKYFTRMHT